MHPSDDHTLALRDDAPSPVLAAASLTAAMLGGLVGHRPGPWQSRVPRLAFRAGLRDVAPDRLLDRWRGSAPGRSLDVCVYLHGLLVDEQNWRLGAHDLPDAVYAATGHVPVHVRYNSGLRVSHNGAHLADALEALHAAWGPRLGRIHLVGHSMGGLVCRSALHMLQIRNSSTRDRVATLALLGTPNHGASLERLVAQVEAQLLRGGLDLPRSVEAAVRGALPSEGTSRLAGAMARVSTGPLRAVQALLGLRSDGIRDLRHGFLIQADWERSPAPATRARDLAVRTPVPIPPDIRVIAIGGALREGDTAEPSTERTDGLVTTASAAGVGPFDDVGALAAGTWVEIPRLVHQAIPGSRRVRAALVDQLARPARVATVAANPRERGGI